MIGYRTARPDGPRPRDSALAARTDLDCLRAIRRELRATYPRVRVDEIFRVMRRYSVKEIPEGLLLSAGSRREARSKLSRAANPQRARRINWHPLFSSEYYLATNSDVAAAGASPWLHYQVFGRAEGRSPHPLIDTDFLGSSLPSVRREDILDEYLARPEYWTADTSPYVDCLRYMLEGEWDGHSNPLVQIVRHHLNGPWVHRRLMLVDAASESQARARLTGVGALLTLNTSGSQFAEIRSWQVAQGHESPESLDDQNVEYTVIPGFFLGAKDQEVTSDPTSVISPDSTMIRLASEFVSLTKGDLISTPALNYLVSSLSYEQLVAIIHSSPNGTVLSPSSQGQAIALRELRVRLGVTHVSVLEYGRQVRVRSTRLRVTKGRPLTTIPEWNWGRDSRPESVAVVLAHAHRRRSYSDRNVRDLLQAGAALCMIESEDIASWIPILQNRAHVIVDPAALEYVRGVVAQVSLFLLPGGEVGNQS